MLRRLARTLLVLLATFGLLPGAGGAVEHVVELLTHGHVAHSVEGEQDPLADEHGCTPVQHHCPCHDGQSVTEQGQAGAIAARALALTWMLEAERVPRGDSTQRRWENDLPPANRSTAPPTPPANA